MLKMKSLVAMVFLATCCSIMPGHPCYGFERDYVERAVLTDQQEKTVLELAKKRGIKKVGKIYTYNIHPTAARGIGGSWNRANQGSGCYLRGTQGDVS